MVVRCSSTVPGTSELRSQVGEVGEGDRSGLQSVPVTVGKIGSDYRYPGTVITVYIGNKMVYAGDSVDNAVDKICSPGGIDYELFSV